MGIRDPLYLAALRLAGCDLSGLGDLSNLDAMPVERCSGLLKAWHMRSREEHQIPQQVVQLQVKNLSYSYDGIKPALKALDATIYQGEMVSILGSNGAGKSTLAQVLMGVLKQDSGDIFFEDRLINDNSASQRSSMIGFVMQNPNHMISCDLVYDEVAFALRQAGMPRTDQGPGDGCAGAVRLAAIPSLADFGSELWTEEARDHSVHPGHPTQGAHS